MKKYDGLKIFILIMVIGSLLLIGIPTYAASSPFNDDFNDGNANGWTTYGGAWSVTSGQYGVNADPGAKSIASSASFTNLVYEADVMVGSTGNAGLIFRVNSPGVGADSFYGYYAGIDCGNQRVQVGKMSNNWTELATASMAITANTMVHMKVVASGSNIKIFVGDMTTPKININDTTHTSGAIGVRTYQTAAKFDNISVIDAEAVATLFSDNFNDNDYNGWTTYAGSWTVPGGVLTSVSGSCDKAVAGNIFSGNYSVEADLKVINQGQASLIFNVSNPASGTDSLTGYSAGIDTGGTIWLGKHNNSWTQLAGAGASISAGALYHIKVSVNNGNIKVYLDGGLKINVNDSSFTSGKIGVRGGFSNNVSFDNVTVTTNATPNYINKIMPLGDSITDGFNVPGGYRIQLWNKIINNSSAVDFLGSQSNGPSNIGDLDHEGHPGWRIDQIDANINAWMDTFQPTIVLLHIGTNDVNQNYDLANAPARLSALIDKICAKLPVGGKLFVAKITPESDPTQNQGVVNYNNQIPSIVQSKVSAGKPVYMVDMYSALTTSDLADGVHPNAGGYAKMATVWFNAIQSSLIIAGSGTNLSKGKTATVSTYYSVDYNASKALDGDSTTRWAANGVAKPQWLNVDLGQNRNISRVETQFEFGFRYVKYKIEYSTDNTNWSVYADRTGNTSINNLYVDFNTVTARFVRITATDTELSAQDWICIWEFQVYGN